MAPVELRGSNGDRRRERRKLEPRIDESFVKPLAQRHRELHSPASCQQCQLPADDRRDEDSVRRFHHVQRALRESIRRAEEPHPGVRVQGGVQRRASQSSSNVKWTSSSSEQLIRTDPSSDVGRGRRFSATTSTGGSPPRVTTRPSPVEATRSMSSRQCAANSSTGISRRASLARAMIKASPLIRSGIQWPCCDATWTACDPEPECWARRSAPC